MIDRMTRKEAAEYLGVAPQTLAGWASSGMVRLPYLRIGKSTMYRKRDLDAFLDSRVASSVAGHRQLLREAAEAPPR